jgi:flagellar hook-basal body complex protein FliE
MAITPPSLGSIASAAGASFIPNAAPAQGFGGVLSSAIQQVNNLQDTAEEKVASLLSGNGQDIHAAALSVEQASLAFDLMLQVRNKVVSAYQEISRLQF